MKSRTLTCIAATTLLAALALPVRLAAQEQQPQQKKQPRYSVRDLGTLGGTFSLAGGINNRGDVEGYSTLLGDEHVHAFFWQHGLMRDLGTLGGPNSFAIYRPSERGQVGGASDTATPDPLGEDFCGNGNNLICLPFVWQKGVMTPLPTLTGNNGAADGFNNRGQVVGLAETATIDPTCVETSQVLETKPVIWEDGEIEEELPTFSEDPDGEAVAINDRGQAIGHSGTCIHPNLHAVLWQDGTAINLGNLGGTRGNLSVDINNRGQVVGQSNLPGDEAFHAFLWQKGEMTDLGTLPGDFASDADGINNKGQVVGGSFDIDFNSRAFLWQNGVMTDLNTLIPADSPLFLIEATGTINSRGQIAGIALQTSTGELHAFLATPKNEEPDEESRSTATSAATARSSKVILPENVRNMLRERQTLGGGRLMKRQ
jgi:probable HAF family extracellular repeat protein